MPLESKADTLVSATPVSSSPAPSTNMGDKRSPSYAKPAFRRNRGRTLVWGGGGERKNIGSTMDHVGIRVSGCGGSAGCGSADGRADGSPLLPEVLTAEDEERKPLLSCCTSKYDNVSLSRYDNVSDILLPEGLESRLALYVAETNERDKEKAGRDAVTEWADKDVVVGTSTIAAAIDYNPSATALQFDRVCHFFVTAHTDDGEGPPPSSVSS